MFNDNDDCKIVDWQFTATGSIFLDFGTLGYFSTDPHTTESNLESIKDAYFSEFKRICDLLKVALPWTRVEFGNLTEDLGLFIAFLWCSTSYELVKKYPRLLNRAHWCLHRSIAKTPQFYQ